MDKSRELKNLVKEQNIKVHAKEAPVYETIHPELFNFYHTRKSLSDMRFIFGTFASQPEVKVLDLGCGTGFLTLKAATFPNAYVTAVDLSKEMLAQLEKKIDSSQRNRISLVTSDASDFIRSNDVQYDLIISSALLHHLVDFEEFITSALARLRPGGIFYIAYEPLKQGISSKLRFALHSWVRALDLFIFNRRMRLLRIKVDEDHKRTIADYQTTLGGISPFEVISRLQPSGTVVRFDRFAVRANGFLAFVADKIIKSQNTFSIIFQKS